MSRSDIESRSDWLSKASILTDALPFMRRYADSRVVVKFGGHAMGDGNLCLLYTSPSPRDLSTSRMPSSA